MARTSEGPSSVAAEQGYLRLWFTLARKPWQTLVLVPGSPQGSADHAARLLAEVGQKVSGLPVRAITMSALDYGTALALADLQEQVRRYRIEGEGRQEFIEVPAPGAGQAARDQFLDIGASPPPEDGSEAGVLQPPRGLPIAAARFVIAVPCLLSEPLGLAATQGADAVLILLEEGRSALADAKKIIEQVGRERIAGCVLVK